MTHYRIQWKYLTTDNNSTVQGEGHWHDSKELLEETILHYNKKYKGEIHHWLQTK